MVDAATAARYDLPTAQLLNAAGNYVAPTPESLLAGEAAMKPSAVAGVLASAPRASDPAAYPLTALSYAVTAPATLDAAAGKDYAAFLRYAAGPGQQQGLDPGQLPLGMVPLPDPLKAQTIAAATTIESADQQESHRPTGPPPISGIAGTNGTNQARPAAPTHPQAPTAPRRTRAAAGLQRRSRGSSRRPGPTSPRYPASPSNRLPEGGGHRRCPRPR